MEVKKSHLEKSRMARRGMAASEWRKRCIVPSHCSRKLGGTTATQNSLPGPGMVVHTFNPSNQETEAGGSL